MKLNSSLINNIPYTCFINDFIKRKLMSDPVYISPLVWVQWLSTLHGTLSPNLLQTEQLHLVSLLHHRLEEIKHQSKQNKTQQVDVWPNSFKDVCIT